MISTTEINCASGKRTFQEAPFNWIGDSMRVEIPPEVGQESFAKQAGELGLCRLLFSSGEMLAFVCIVL